MGATIPDVSKVAGNECSVDRIFKHYEPITTKRKLHLYQYSKETKRQRDKDTKDKTVK